MNTDPLGKMVQKNVQDAMRRLQQAKEDPSSAFEKAAAELPFRPLQWRVVVWPMPAAEQSEGGIFIPDEARETEEFRTNVGLLVAVGANAFKAVTKNALSLGDEKNPVPGNWVLYPEYAGSLMTVFGADTEGKRKRIKYRVMNDTDIIGVTEFPGAFRGR